MGPEDLRDIYWDARWEGLVMFGEAIWSAALANWWVGPIIVVLALTATRRAWLRLFGRVAGTYARSEL